MYNDKKNGKIGIIITIIIKYYIITLGEENDIYNYLYFSIRYMVFFKNI